METTPPPAERIMQFFTYAHLAAIERGEDSMFLPDALREGVRHWRDLARRVLHEAP